MSRRTPRAQGATKDRLEKVIRLLLAGRRSRSRRGALGVDVPLSEARLALLWYLSHAGTAGLTHAEAARLLDVSPSAIHVLTRRMRDVLVSDARRGRNRVLTILPSGEERLWAELEPWLEILAGSEGR